MPPSRSGSPRDNASAIAALLRSLTFALDVPGQHYGGLSNQALFEWVAARMPGTKHDVPIAPLARDYAKWKRANGFDPRPGVMRGDLLEAVRSAGLDAR